MAAPDVNLSLDTVMATLRSRQSGSKKKLSNAEDRRIVQAMYDELQATGRVEHSLPEDDRIIRDLHKREVLDVARAKQSDKRAVRVPEGDPAAAQRAQAARQGQSLAPAAPAFDGKATAPPPGRRRAGSKSRPSLHLKALPGPAPRTAAPTPHEVPLELPPRGTHGPGGPKDAERRAYLTAMDRVEKRRPSGPRWRNALPRSASRPVAADFLARSPRISPR